MSHYDSIKHQKDISNRQYFSGHNNYETNHALVGTEQRKLSRYIGDQGHIFFDPHQNSHGNVWSNGNIIQPITFSRTKSAQARVIQPEKNRYDYSQNISPLLNKNQHQTQIDKSKTVPLGSKPRYNDKMINELSSRVVYANLQLIESIAKNNPAPGYNIKLMIALKTLLSQSAIRRIATSKNISTEELIKILDENASVFLTEQEKLSVSKPIRINQPVAESNIHLAKTVSDPNQNKIAKNIRYPSDDNPDDFKNNHIAYSKPRYCAKLNFQESRTFSIPKWTQYPDFYRKEFFSEKRTISHPETCHKQPEFFSGDIKLINGPNYNKNIHPRTIAPCGNNLFFHQRQRGPYCQTISINNFIGDDILTPDIAFHKLNLEDGHISLRLHNLETLELFSKLRNEQVKVIEHLSQASMPTPSMIKKMMDAKILVEELNCRACNINRNNSRQINSIVQAAERSNIGRIHLSFMTDSGKGHVIALRKDPDHPNLWNVLDGNLPQHRRKLIDILTGYTDNGTMHLIAHKNLFKMAPEIAGYKIKQSRDGGNSAVIPSDKHLTDWFGISEKELIEQRYNDPDTLHREFYRWKRRQEINRINLAYKIRGQKPNNFGTAVHTPPALGYPIQIR